MMRYGLTFVVFCSICLSVQAASVFEFTATVLSLDQRLSTNEALYGRIWGEPIQGRLVLEPLELVPSGLHPVFPGVPLGEWALRTSPRSSLLLSFGAQQVRASAPRIVEAPEGAGVNVMQLVDDGFTEFVELYWRGEFDRSLDLELPDVLTVAELAIFTKQGVIEARIDRIELVPEPPQATFGIVTTIGMTICFRRRRTRTARSARMVASPDRMPRETRGEVG